MSLKIINSTGDLLKSKANIICHQTNCIGVMGAGVALQIKNKYPNVYQVYHNYCNIGNPLGNCLLINSLTGKPYNTYYFKGCRSDEINVNCQYIANLFGQYTCNAYTQSTDYDALTKSVVKLCDLISNSDNLHIASPYKLGCGLAGGNWKVVYDIFVNTLQNFCLNKNKNVILEIVKWDKENV